MLARSISNAMLVVVVGSTIGCGAGVNWSNHLALRSYGKSLRLAQIEPAELAVTKISRNLNYVSIALDSVFFRDLPGLNNRAVVFGFEIRGAGDKPIKTVLDVTESAGDHAFLSLDNVVVLQPFLYTGKNLEITLWFKATPRDNVANIKGRLAGAGDLLKKLNPMASEAIQTATSVFDSVIGAFESDDLTWKYSFTLYPSDSVMRDKPDLLLTAGRHVLIATPPADAPHAYRMIGSTAIRRYVGLRGNRLVWLYNGEEFVELPYIILNVTRYKRYPNDSTPLRKAVREADKAYEQGNLKLARARLRDVGSLIFEDKVITQREKNLEQVWKEFREARIDAAQAARDGNVEKQLAAMRSEIRHLGDILSGFVKILEPFEVKDIEFRISRLVAHYKRIAGARATSFPGGRPAPPRHLI